MAGQSTKTKTSTFIVEIPLVVSPKDIGVLSSRFEAGRQVYNACLDEAMRRLKLVKQSQKYQAAKKLNKGSKDRTEAFKDTVGEIFLNILGDRQEASVWS